VIKGLLQGKRAQELSCDRIGALATRNLRPVVARAIKQGIMPPCGAQVGLRELTAQAAELQGGMLGLASRVRQFNQAEPDLIFRLKALTE
jgi:hypothetical protein